MSSEAGPRHIRLVTAAVLFGLFLAGLVTGAVLCRFVGPRPQWPPGPPGGLPPGLARQDLPPEVDAKLKEIVQRQRTEIDAVLRETFPRVRAIEERTDREIREALPEAARPAWDEHVKSRERFQRGRPGPPGGGGPPDGAPFPPGGPPPPPPGFQ